MNEISGVPDKYVKLFPKGSEQAPSPTARRSPRSGRTSTNSKPKPRSSRMRAPRRRPPPRKAKELSQTAFNDMTKICKECHETYRSEEKEWVGAVGVTE